MALCGVVIGHKYICVFFFFFFNDTATTEIYTLSLHDALPIYWDSAPLLPANVIDAVARYTSIAVAPDRKSTRLNSSHSQISYAVFCLKKKTSNLAYRAERHPSTPIC